MKIKIEIEIEHCSECPFTKTYREHGCTMTECSKCGAYSEIPEQGIRKDCPFRK